MKKEERRKRRLGEGKSEGNLENETWKCRRRKNDDKKKKMKKGKRKRDWERERVKET